MRPSPRHLRVLLVLAVGLVAACGGDDDSDAAVPTEDTVTEDTGTEDTGTEDTGTESPPETEGTTDDTSDGAAPLVADACALLDADFLNETFEGQTGTFGEPFDFQASLQEPPSDFCSWKDVPTGLALQVTVEDAATTETDDHSDRAYNLDVEPTVQPQDGPGEKAVLLIDEAFDDAGGAGLAYGYFFVEGDVAVFVETVGLDIGAEALRTLADEADARLLAG